MTAADDAHKLRTIRAWGKAEPPRPKADRKPLSWWKRLWLPPETRGIDNPTDAFVLRRCDRCGSPTWVPGPLGAEPRVACRRCAVGLTGLNGDPRPKVTRTVPVQATRPATAPATRADTNRNGDAERTRQLANFLRSEIAEGHRFLARYAPPEGLEERARAIRQWNDAYSRNVEADVTETMMLGIPKREGEAEDHYLARLKRTADRWREKRAQSIFPPTPANASPLPPERQVSPPSARRAARKTG